MDESKSCRPSADYATAAGSSGGGGRDDYLRNLNKISHKIGKPLRRSPLEQTLAHHYPRPPVPPPPSPLRSPPEMMHPPNLQQPPVYSINKNDFRDVVQKLTGSPAHEHMSNPPPIHPPKPQSSRLQRIRPPPLASVINRPPSMLDPVFAFPASAGNHVPNQFGSSFRQPAPLSPLPPLPSVHGAAESPVTAYMKYMRGSMSEQLSTRRSPLWYNPQLHQIPIVSPSSSGFTRLTAVVAPPPQPFGCSPSPSPYPLLSPGAVFSPTAGQSPRMNLH